MPIASHLWRSLQKQYGPEKGRNVYFGMEEEAKQGKRPSFTKALNTAKSEGHVMGVARPKPSKTTGRLRGLRKKT